METAVVLPFHTPFHYAVSIYKSAEDSDSMDGFICEEQQLSVTQPAEGVNTRCARADTSLSFAIANSSCLQIDTLTTISDCIYQIVSSDSLIHIIYILSSQIS